jgi:exonuclease SbcC
MTPRLKNLVLNDFRSLKGPVVVPLDAQVVLVHGSNGMGKTSVLTGIELGLTGQISHLAEAGKPYQSHMAHVDVGHGSIELQTTAALDDLAEMILTDAQDKAAHSGVTELSMATQSAPVAFAKPM